jgi:hypothetical protein
MMVIETKCKFSFVEDIVSKMMTSGKIKHDFCRWL